MTFKPIAWLARLGLGSGTLLGVAGVVAAALANPFPTVLAGAAVGLLRRRRRRRSPSSQGTARFADHTDLARFNLLSEHGLIVGRTDQHARPSLLAAARSIFSPRVGAEDAVRAFLAAFLRGKGHAGQFIRICDHIHLATFAATGRGKGQSVLKPVLMTFSGSVVVVDPDGELLRSVGGHREAFGQRNIVLAPFGIPGRPGLACDTLNPLSFIDPASPTFLDDCIKLAALLVVRTGDEKEVHFLEAAEVVITGVIAFVVACEPNPELRTLQVVRDIVSSPDRFARTIDHMARMGGLMARLGNQLKWFRDRELGSVMTTTGRMLRFVDSPIVAASLEKSTFDPAIVRDNASLWLVLPSDRMQNLAQIMRLWVGTILTRLTRDAADESKTVLFLIDEAANIGHIPQLEEAVTLMRKRGIRLWFFFQSLGQLQKCYGDRANVFIENIDTQTFFGINAFDSAEAISKRLGQETILVRSHNASSGSSRQYGGQGGVPSDGENRSSGSTVSEQGRALLRPEELLLLDGEAIIFHRSCPPIRAVLPLAHADPEFRPGTRARRRPAGVTSLLLSAGWLAGGASVFGWGSGQAEGLWLDVGPSLVPASLRATAGRLWAAIAAEETPLSEAEIAEELHRAVMRAYAASDAKFRASRNFHPLRIPPGLRPGAIQHSLAEAITAAELEAERKRQLLPLPSPGRGRMTLPAGWGRVIADPARVKHAADGGE